MRPTHCSMSRSSFSQEKNLGTVSIFTLLPDFQYFQYLSQIPTQSHKENGITISVPYIWLGSCSRLWNELKLLMWDFIWCPLILWPIWAIRATKTNRQRPLTSLHSCWAAVEAGGVGSSFCERCSYTIKSTHPESIIPDFNFISLWSWMIYLTFLRFS